MVATSCGVLRVENSRFLPVEFTIIMNWANQHMRNLLRAYLRMLGHPDDIPKALPRSGRYQIQASYFIGSTVSKLPGLVNRCVRIHTSKINANRAADFAGKTELESALFTV